MEKYRAQETDGLLARKPTVSPPKITQQELSHLVHELNRGAVSHGFPGQIRTCVNEVIGRLFGWSATAGQLRPDASGPSLKKGGGTVRRAAYKSPPPGRRPAKPVEGPAVAGGDGAGLKKSPR